MKKPLSAKLKFSVGNCQKKWFPSTYKRRRENEDDGEEACMWKPNILTNSTLAILKNIFSEFLISRKERFYFLLLTQVSLEILHRTYIQLSEQFYGKFLPGRTYGLNRQSKLRLREAVLHPLIWQIKKSSNERTIRNKQKATSYCAVF